MSTVDTSNPTSSNSGSETSFGVPEGRLGNYYEYAVTQTLERYLSSINYSLFKKKFPEISKECNTELRELSNELVKQLRATITADIKHLSQETSVFKSLKSLDDMITEQKDRTGEDAWRPSGNPEEDVRDHVYQQKQKQKQYLEFVLETLKAENNMLEKTVEENHREILNLKEEFNIEYQEVQSNLAAIDGFDFLKLHEDMHAMFGKH